MNTICAESKSHFCCGGFEHAATEALKISEKFIPWQVFVISRDKQILE